VKAVALAVVASTLWRSGGSEGWRCFAGHAVARRTPGLGRWAGAAGSGRAVEVSDESDMLNQLREWKRAKKDGAKPPASSPKPAQQEPAPVSVSEGSVSSSPAPKAPAEPMAQPAPAPVSKSVSANDAIAELLAMGQQKADPTKLSPQQLVAVFFTFFVGWRERHDVAGDIELTQRQKQTVVLIIRGALSTIRAANEFWPSVCAELGSSRDPEMRELMFALTGFNH